MRVKRLGRGLENLLNRTGPDSTTEPGAKEAEGAAPEGSDRGVPGNGRGNGQGVVRQIPLDVIRANPFQPRRVFAEEGIAELCDSIREHGLLQPVVVRVAGEGFEIVAGERRLRAARAIGMKRIAALVRSASNEEMQTLALVENLQREDLNAMEKARALHAMMRNFVLTQEDVATRVGKARTTIANLLRLLDLPEEIQAWVEEGKLSGAHARAVLQAKGEGRRVELARQAVLQGWSVREVERRARSGPTVGRRRTRTEDPYVRDLEERLRRALSTDVRVKPRGKGGKGGRIEIPYHDADELDRLLELLKA